MNLTIDHYVCLSNRVRDALVVDLANDFAPPPAEYVLRATGVHVRIFFCRRVNGALEAYDPGAGIGINYGAKRNDQIVGTASPTLFETSSFTRDATDPAKVFWIADLNLNTTEFSGAFTSSPLIDLSGSIEITEDGEEFPAAIFEALGVHDILRDTDTPPTAALPPYPTTPTAETVLAGNSTGTAWVKLTFAALWAKFLADVSLLFPWSRISGAPTTFPPSALTALTGGGAGSLDGVATAGGATTTTTIREVLSGSVGGGDLAVSRWVLMDGTNPEDGAGYVRPDDYDAGTNARIWVRIG